jgi:hypothetical protein
MPMLAAYLNELRDRGIAIITHFGLVDETGTELTGGDPAYARIADTPVADGDGVVRPSTNLVFNVPEGTTVGGWRAYSAGTEGTDWGGEAVTQEAFAAQGQYTLQAAGSSITHVAVTPE